MTTEPNKQTEPFQLKDLKKAFLVGIYSSGDSTTLCNEHLAELHRLCDSFGLPVIGQIACPIKKLEAGTYLGSGKIEEIFQETQERIDVINPHIFSLTFYIHKIINIIFLNLAIYFYI